MGVVIAPPVEVSYYPNQIWLGNRYIALASSKGNQSLLHSLSTSISMLMVMCSAEGRLRHSGEFWIREAIR